MGLDTGLSLGQGKWNDIFCFLVLLYTNKRAILGSAHILFIRPAQSTVKWKLGFTGRLKLTDKGNISSSLVPNALHRGIDRIIDIRALQDRLLRKFGVGVLLHQELLLLHVAGRVARLARIDHTLVLVAAWVANVDLTAEGVAQAVARLFSYQVIEANLCHLALPVTVLKLPAQNVLDSDLLIFWINDEKKLVQNCFWPN